MCLSVDPRSYLRKVKLIGSVMCLIVNYVSFTAKTALIAFIGERSSSDWPLGLRDHEILQGSFGSIGKVSSLSTESSKSNVV